MKATINMWFAFYYTEARFIEFLVNFVCYLCVIRKRCICGKQVYILNSTTLLLHSCSFLFITNTVSDDSYISETDYIHKHLFLRYVKVFFCFIALYPMHYSLNFTFSRMDIVHILLMHEGNGMWEVGDVAHNTENNYDTVVVVMTKTIIGC